MRYKDLGTGVEHEFTILGPWDTQDGDHVISYRAPLAAGLLGRRPGDKTRIVLPSGVIEVQVLGVKLHDLDH